MFFIYSRGISGATCSFLCSSDRLTLPLMTQTWGLPLDLDLKNTSANSSLFAKMEDRILPSNPPCFKNIYFYCHFKLTEWSVYNNVTLYCTINSKRNEIKMSRALLVLLGRQRRELLGWGRTSYQKKREKLGEGAFNPITFVNKLNKRIPNCCNFISFDSSHMPSPSLRSAFPPMLAAKLYCTKI